MIQVKKFATVTIDGDDVMSLANCCGIAKAQLESGNVTGYAVGSIEEMKQFLELLFNQLN